MKLNKDKPTHYEKIETDEEINITCTVKSGAVTVSLIEKLKGGNTKVRQKKKADANNPVIFYQIKKSKNGTGKWSVEVKNQGKGESEFQMSQDVSVGSFVAEHKADMFVNETQVFESVNGGALEGTVEVEPLESEIEEGDTNK